MMTGLAGAAMWLMMGLMLVGVLTGGIAWARRRLHGTPADQPPPGDQPPPADQTPQELLRHRYAAGQIDRDEYLRRQRDLSEH